MSHTSHLKRYTTIGNVRGSCGHIHRSVEAAAECLRRDQRDCRKAGGYSDRKVERVAGWTPGGWAILEPLDDREARLLEPER